MKIGILTGDIPSRPFIENLILSLASKKDVELVIIGKQKKPVSYPRNVKIFNYGGSRFKLFWRRKTFPILYASRWRKMKPFISGMKSNGYGGNIDLALSFARHELDVVHYNWIDLDKLLIQINKALGSAIIGSLRGYQINVKPIVFPYIQDKYTELFAQFDAFHSVSKAITAQVARFGVSQDKCRVIYSGTKIDSSNKKEVNSDGVMHLTSVGRGNWIKAYDLALNSMKMLKNRGIEFRYSIVIGNPPEELLFLRKEMELEKEIEFLPTMSHDQVLKHVASANALLLPSHLEGVANVVLEAMAIGTPVISADCGGMPEVIEHEKSGLLFKTSDAESMASAIEQFHHTSAEEIEKWVQAAYQRIVEFHQIDALGEQMLDWYKHVLENKKASTSRNAQVHDGAIHRSEPF